MQVNMDEAKSNLSELGELAWKGEEVVIAKAGKPFLRLTPYDSAEQEDEKPKRRPLGLLKGQIWIAPDFDDTPEEMIDLFYNDGKSASSNLPIHVSRDHIGAP